MLKLWVCSYLEWIINARFYPVVGYGSVVSYFWSINLEINKEMTLSSVLVLGILSFAHLS